MDPVTNPSIVNAQFVQDVANGGEDLKKTAAFTGAFIMDKLRERTFADKIIVPKPVKKGDPKLIRSRTHDTLVYRDDIQPNSRAISLTFRDRPETNYVDGLRYDISFFRVGSQEHEKTIDELMAYDYPILQEIEKQILPEMDNVKDFWFITYVEAAVQQQAAAISAVTGQYPAGSNIIRGEQAVAAFVAAGNAFDGTRGRVRRNDLIELGKLFSNSRRPKGPTLWALPDFDDVAAWTIEDFGDGQQKVTFQGLGEAKLGAGKDAVTCYTTIKTDIVQPGNIYLFTPEEFLGRSLTLRGVDFWAEKVRNMIRFSADMVIGMGIANIASIAKLELYNGQGAADGASDALPAEDTIGGGVFNQVEQGFFFPQVALV